MGFGGDRDHVAVLNARRSASMALAPSGACGPRCIVLHKPTSHAISGLGVFYSQLVNCSVHAVLWSTRGVFGLFSFPAETVSIPRPEWATSIRSNARARLPPQLSILPQAQCRRLRPDTPICPIAVSGLWLSPCPWATPLPARPACVTIDGRSNHHPAGPEPASDIDNWPAAVFRWRKADDGKAIGGSGSVSARDDFLGHRPA